MTTTSIGELGRALAEFSGAHKADVIAAADVLAAASDDATWDAAWKTWATQRVNVQLQAYLMAGLPDLPGLAELLARIGWDSEQSGELAEGLHGSLGVGPVSLTLGSGSLIGPPPRSGCLGRRGS
jgi:hypothetical protein